MISRPSRPHREGAPATKERVAARLFRLVALLQERHLQTVDAVTDQRQQSGQQERGVEHRREHAERTAHAQLGDERDADHGQAGDRDRDRQPGEDHRATRGRRGVGGGLAWRHAVVQRLSEARDDEERVVDADADADHRDEDRGDRVEVGQVREQEEQGEGRADRKPGEEDRDAGGHERRNTISSTISATPMPMSSLAPCSGGAWSASPVNSVWTPVFPSVAVSGPPARRSCACELEAILRELHLGIADAADGSWRAAGCCRRTGR